MKSKEFNALIIDASTDNLYVMLLSQGEVLGGKSCDSIKKHSETVMTEIDRVLKLGGLKHSDVDVFICGVGCGSFTGLRVAISTVKGLNAPLGKKLVAVNTLETLAYNRAGTTDAVMDAGGGRFYHARYVDGKQTVAPRLISAAQAEELGADGSCVFFDKERDLSDKLAGLGRDKILKGEFSDDLTPLYLRRCQAEELLDAGKL